MAAADGTGRTYVAGEFEDHADIFEFTKDGLNPGVAADADAIAPRSVYLVTYDRQPNANGSSTTPPVSISGGSPLGYTDGKLNAITADPDGYCLGGWYSGDLVFPNGGTDPGSAGATKNGYVVCFDRNHRRQWLRTFAGPDFSQVHDILISGDAVYVAGSFSGETRFVGPRRLGERPILSLNSGSGDDGFLIRYSRVDGTERWISRTTGSGDEAFTVLAREHASAPLYVAGRFASQPLGFRLMQIPPHPEPPRTTADQEVYTAEGESDLFVGAWNANNGTRLYSYHVAGAGPADAMALGITADQVLLAATYSGEIRLPGSSAQQLPYIPDSTGAALISFAVSENVIRPNRSVSVLATAVTPFHVRASDDPREPPFSVQGRLVGRADSFPEHAAREGHASAAWSCSVDARETGSGGECQTTGWLRRPESGDWFSATAGGYLIGRVGEWTEISRPGSLSRIEVDGATDGPFVFVQRPGGPLNPGGPDGDPKIPCPPGESWPDWFCTPPDPF